MDAPLDSSAYHLCVPRVRTLHHRRPCLRRPAPPRPARFGPMASCALRSASKTSKLPMTLGVSGLGTHVSSIVAAAVPAPHCGHHHRHPVDERWGGLINARSSRRPHRRTARTVPRVDGVLERCCFRAVDCTLVHGLVRDGDRERERVGAVELAVSGAHLGPPGLTSRRSGSVCAPMVNWCSATYLLGHREHPWSWSGWLGAPGWCRPLATGRDRPRGSCRRP